jgi:hypothetical protein
VGIGAFSSCADEQAVRKMSDAVSVIAIPLNLDMLGRIAR